MRENGLKRKNIGDYFLPITKRQTPNTAPPCLNPLATVTRTGDGGFQPGTATSVPDLTLHKAFVSPTEEQEVLAYLNDASQCTWRSDLSRRTMHFGGTYCLMPTKSDLNSDATPKILQAPAMPRAFDWLIQRMVDAQVFSTDHRPQYCIVNEYTGNLGISAHTENFQFGEPVVGLSLLSPCSIRFHELIKPYDGSVRSGKAGKAEKTGQREVVMLPGRSLLIMRGASRWKWQHEIVRSAKGRGLGWKRVSLTFRYKPDEKQTSGKDDGS